jgi:fructose-1,6-bisphosphatase
MTIEKVIEETRQLQGTPLTANKYLISKVIKRRPEDFTYVIDGIVDEISKTLNELYPTMERLEKAEP